MSTRLAAVCENGDDEATPGKDGKEKGVRLNIQIFLFLILHFLSPTQRTSKPGDTLSCSVILSPPSPHFLSPWEFPISLL